MRSLSSDPLLSRAAGDLAGHGKLVAIDRDVEAVAAAQSVGDRDEQPEHQLGLAVHQLDERTGRVIVILTAVSRKRPEIFGSFSFQTYIFTHFLYLPCHHQQDDIAGLHKNIRPGQGETRCLLY